MDDKEPRSDEITSEIAETTELKAPETESNPSPAPRPLPVPFPLPLPVELFVAAAAAKAITEAKKMIANVFILTRFGLTDYSMKAEYCLMIMETSANLLY